MKRKVACVFFAAALVFALTACGSAANGDNGSGASSDASDMPASTGSQEPGSGNGSSPDTGSLATPSATSPGDENAAATDNGAAGGGSDTGGGDTGGGGGSGSSSGLPEAPIDVLTALLEAIEAADVWVPMSMPPMAAPDVERHNAIGLSDDDYAQYIQADAQSLAGITTQAHQIVVYRCLSDSAAAQVKSLITGAGGYDPQKWVCVFPEVAVAVEAGSYVLLVASYRDVADAALEAFREMAGDIGDPVVFYDAA